MEATKQKIRIISSTDKCDACGSRAYHRVSIGLNSGSSNLFFCGHHGNKHKEALSSKGYLEWLDESEFILE